MQLNIHICFIINDSFEDFCRYILPYRFAEGLCLDNSRDVFYNRHEHIFNDPIKILGRYYRTNTGKCCLLLSMRFQIELNSIEGDNSYFMTDSIDAWENNICLSNHKKYKYIQFIPPKDTIALCEIAFFEQENKNTPIKDIRVSADITSFAAAKNLERIIDNISASGFKGIFKN